MEQTDKIYATHGEKKFLAVKVRINGELSLAYIKDGNIISYEPWEDVCKKMYSGTCKNYVLVNA